MGRWRPIVTRFILPFASPRSVFQSRNGLTTAMNARLQRELELLGEAPEVYLSSAKTITFRARGKLSVSLRRGKRSEKKIL